MDGNDIKDKQEQLDDDEREIQRQTIRINQK